MSSVSIAVLTATLAFAPTAPGATGADGEAREQTTRTVYVSVTNNDGQPITGLTPQDITLRENNRDREITAIEPAADRMRVAVLVEEVLTPAGDVRQGILDFVRAMAPRAEISIILVADGNRQLVPYTADVKMLAEGINSLLPPLRPQPGMVPDGIFDVAAEFAKQRTVRPVIVAIAFSTVSSEESSRRQPQAVLNQLRDSNAQVHIVVVRPPLGGVGTGLMDSNDRAQVLADAPRQTGGLHVPVSAMTGVPAAMLSIANDLSTQYKVIYVLPDGTKPSDRLSVSSNRRGVTLRAPTRIWAGPVEP